MMYQAQLPRKLWAEAIRHAVWLKNCTPTKILGTMTPFEKLYGEKPNLAGLPEWGQITWVHNTTGSKLDACAKRAQWVGFDYQSTHAHRIFWPEKNIISVECDINFAQQTTSSQKHVNTIPKQVSNIQVDNVPCMPSPAILPPVPH